MKKLLILTLCLAVTTEVLASENDYHVMYDGGSVQGIKAGDKASLEIGPKDIIILRNGKPVVDIPAASVTEISYGEDVHRRVGAAIGLATVSLGVGALMALSKSKKHFVGITWADGDTHGGFAMQCDKSDYRGVLTGLEGVTGKHASDSAALTVKN